MHYICYAIKVGYMKNEKSSVSLENMNKEEVGERSEPRKF